MGAVWKEQVDMLTWGRSGALEDGSAGMEGRWGALLSGGPGRFLGTFFSEKEKLKSSAESWEEEGRRLVNRLKV